MVAKIDPKHPLHPDRRTAITRLRINRLDQPARRRPLHHMLHLGQKRRSQRRLAIAIEPCRRQHHLLHRSNLCALDYLCVRIIT
jgi:hypothetical protein